MPTRRSQHRDSSCAVPVWALALLSWIIAWGLSSPTLARRFPTVVLITVDTLRADHVSAYGYDRETTPSIDRLFAEGVRFDNARTVEPLTNPSLSSMITSLYPHQHGATRNGLTIHPDLPSFTKQLSRRGFKSAAFVGNWTLKDEISGLGEHFDEYREVFTRNRWLIMKGEATAEDITNKAINWLDKQTQESPDQPVLLWVHYVEPHAPYRTQRSRLKQIGLPANSGELGPVDRYDSEVAFVDHWIGVLLEAVDSRVPPEESLIVFAADHGESLGEHHYWGHGRNLKEPGLRIPMGLRWTSHLQPRVVEAPATILDIGPTVLGLIGHPTNSGYEGWDWAEYLASETSEMNPRPTFLQAHKGAVQGLEDKGRARQRGLLRLGMIHNGVKEILDLSNRVSLFDLGNDPKESHRQEAHQVLSPELLAWQVRVLEGLIGADSLPIPFLDEEGRDQMKSLGYLKK